MAPLIVVVTLPDTWNGRPPTSLNVSVTSRRDVIPPGLDVTSGVSRGAARLHVALGTSPIVRLLPSGSRSVREPSAAVVSVVVVPSGAARVRVMVPAGPDSAR